MAAKMMSVAPALYAETIPTAAVSNAAPPSTAASTPGTTPFPKAVLARTTIPPDTTT